MFSILSFVIISLSLSQATAYFVASSVNSTWVTYTDDIRLNPTFPNYYGIAVRNTTTTFNITARLCLLIRDADDKDDNTDDYDCDDCKNYANKVVIIQTSLNACPHDIRLPVSPTTVVPPTTDCPYLRLDDDDITIVNNITFSLTTSNIGSFNASKKYNEELSLNSKSVRILAEDKQLLFCSNLVWNEADAGLSSKASILVSAVLLAILLFQL